MYLLADSLSLLFSLGTSQIFIRRDKGPESGLPTRIVKPEEATAPEKCCFIHSLVIGENRVR